MGVGRERGGGKEHDWGKYSLLHAHYIAHITTVHQQRRMTTVLKHDF